MTLTNISNTKVMDDEDELNWAPIVMPYTRSGSGLVVVTFLETFTEEIVGKFTGLRGSVEIFS